MGVWSILIHTAALLTLSISRLALTIIKQDVSSQQHFTTHIYCCYKKCFWNHKQWYDKIRVHVVRSGFNSSLNSEQVLLEVDRLPWPTSTNSKLFKILNAGIFIFVAVLWLWSWLWALLQLWLLHKRDQMLLDLDRQGPPQPHNNSSCDPMWVDNSRLRYLPN